jgi:hypothetical protein
MTQIGIDFSINSPGICILDTEGYHFISFFNYGGRSLEKKILKAFQLHFSLDEEGIISSQLYNRGVRSKEFLYREREKMEDAENLSHVICEKITGWDMKDAEIYMEGFSYGSKGNSFIDIIQYNSFLRKDLVTLYGKDKISVFQPSNVKKTAGKGNGNKHFMIKAFQDNVLDDDLLIKTELWNWVRGKDYSERIPKPLDDLVDAYFILQTGILNATR